MLHIKRPGLFPILDFQLRTTYRLQAHAAAARHNTSRDPVRFAFWAAVRQDLHLPANITALAELRRDLRAQTDPLARSVAGLGDVRLLDLLTWKPRSYNTCGCGRCR